MNQQERQILQIIEADPMISHLDIAEKLNLELSAVEDSISSLMESGVISGKGYVLKNESYAVVVGGINVDIGGHSFAPPIASDSNPGAVSISLGGVGRNIAHNIALLGVDVRMLSAYGDDINGDRVASLCSEIGIDLSRAQRIPGKATSTYLYITDEKGEMILAINDMEICNCITPEYLEENLEFLNNAQVVVVDANIPEESLKFLGENLTVPIFVDPVSTVKAPKLLPILDKIHTLKPNKLEAELLSGIKIENKDDAKLAAEALLQKGIRRVFISMGGDGIFAATPKEQLLQGVLPGKMVNTTGCGDAAMGAITWAYLEGMSLGDTAKAALAAGAIAMETEETISPVMSADYIRERMG